MADYARVVTFDADEAALEALLNEINSSEGRPKACPPNGSRSSPTARRARSW